MEAIERATAHFGRLPVRAIEVPEWADAEGRPLVVYCTPATLAERAKIARHAEEGRHATLAYTVIFKAKDAQGAPLFTIEHKHALMTRVDSDVLARLVTDMMTAPTLEDQEKNSPRTPSSS